MTLIWHFLNHLGWKLWSWEKVSVLIIRDWFYSPAKEEIKFSYMVSEISEALLSEDLNSCKVTLFKSRNFRGKIGAAIFESFGWQEKSKCHMGYKICLSFWNLWTENCFTRCYQAAFLKQRTETPNGPLCFGSSSCGSPKVTNLTQ